MLKRLLFVVLLALAGAAQATVYSLPWGPKPQFVDANGAPMSSGSFVTFLAGSSTPQVTYTDATNGVSNPTTITLNTRGETPNEVWLAAGVSYKFVLKDSSGITIWTVDNVTGVNDVTAQLGNEWVVSALTPTFISATSFSVTGDQTLVLHPGRRLKTTNSGGTIYSTVSTSVFGAVTIVTVANDSGTLDSGISSVSYGVIGANNTSAPLLNDTYAVRSGSADKTKKLRLEVDGITTATTRVATAPDYDVRIGNLPAGIGCLPYAGATVPTGWLECDGSAVSRTTYAALFTAISTTWNTGGEAGTDFRLPDMRGRVPVGSGTGTVSESVTNAAVNTGTDTVTVASNSTKWVTGMQITWGVTGTPPTTNPANLLDNADTVFVIRNSATTVKFATTLANAQNGTPIDITAAGSGTFTMTNALTARTLAEVGGEESHAMSITELLLHDHTSYSNGGPLAIQGGATTGSNTAPTSATGGNAAMNIMQPFAVMKFIISY